jgi:hypothetical protein
MDTLFMKKQRLSRRIRKNFNDYKAAMLKTNRQHIFDNAPDIIAYQIVCRHMSHVSQYDEQSLDYLLKFENPLQLVTDHFKQDMRVDLDAIIARICNTQDLLNDYSLMPNKKQHAPER